MLLSEFIKILQDKLGEHGDVPVRCGFGCEEADEIDEINVVFDEDSDLRGHPALTIIG